MISNPQELDCIIIGAGAAGLTAATYLARFRRQFITIDAGQSRLLSIPTSHNYPGYPAGIHGHDILDRMRSQMVHYGKSVVADKVRRLEKRPDGSFIASGEHGEWHARTVILATGVVDVPPDFPDVQDAIARGCLRYCPICDGYEAIGKKAAVIGKGKGGLGEAIFVRHFAAEVTLLSLTEALDLSEEDRQRLAHASVRVIHEPVSSMRLREEGMIEVQLRDGGQERFEVVYAALGTRVNSELARSLGAACAPNGELRVDEHQQTSVDGLYAVGDVVAGLNQITVAMGHAAIAATAVHNRLRERD
ncbi:NAD(P)/FAD-dependent oxidoreductase [Noviherbaspirillum massiliense]|uniref:NAD(P)/FAD-dependent oxidoreductase n=1 Tax=Noviherbaspirillum massiliense TaxID=1465823 RepID=UPI0002EE5CE6|nr:NAD(P)/FAD-dependent oxidoreductase [Noviherbaspirillum massiliense]